MHNMVLELLQLDRRKISRDVRQQIRLRVFNLIQNLLRDSSNGDQTACIEGFTQVKTAICKALGDGVADVVPIGHQLPIGEHPSRGLRSALQHMSDQTPRCQTVIVMDSPVELVHQDPQSQGTVCTASGNDNVGTQR